MKVVDGTGEAVATPDAEIAWILSTFRAPVVKLNEPELVPPTRGLSPGALSDGDIRRHAYPVRYGKE